MGISFPSEVKNIHIYEFLRITGFYGVFIFFLVLVLRYGIQIDWVVFESIIINSLIVISITRLLILFYKILNYSAHKKLLIIAYICTAELIPMIIGLNLVLKSAIIYFIV